jgi:hypothetical protein
MCSVSTVLYAQLKCTWHTESIKKPQHLAPNGQAFNVAPLRMLNFTSCASSTILQIVGNYDGSMKARVAFTQNQREVLHLQQPAREMCSYSTRLNQTNQQHVDTSTCKLAPNRHQCSSNKLCNRYERRSNYEHVQCLLAQPVCSAGMYCGFQVFAARFSYPSRRGPICKSDLDILNGSPNWTWSESRCWHFFSYVLHIAKYALRLIN